MDRLTHRAGLAVGCAVVGLLALGSTAQAVDVQMKILNSSGATLRVVNHHLDHGALFVGPEAQAPLAPGATLIWYAAQYGVATGVEGWLDLATEGTNEGQFHFYFDNPFIGSNDYSTSVSGPFAIYRWGPWDG